MNQLDNLRRIVAGWRGEWRVDAHEGITLSHDGDEWPIASMDGDVMIALVELLNAIRPAVDGATAEIERLTGELAAARAVPPDVEAAIKSTVDGAEEAGRCSALGHAYLITKAPFWTVPHLKAAIARAIADATAGAVAYFIDGHAKRLCEQAGNAWNRDDEEAEEWASSVHDVLNHLCADADGTVLDGRASKPATVGGLLATEADALLCRWYAAKQDAIGALVDLENLRRPDPDDSWAGGIGRRDPMPGAEKRAADTKERLVDVTNKVIAAMTRGPIGEG